MKNISILILFMCLHFSCTSSQDPEEIITSFFKTYQQNEPVKALEQLYTHAPWLKGTNEGVEDLKTKFKELKNLNGEFYGYELLNEKNVKNTFVIYTYLVKHENGLLLFTFEFYKPNKTWTLYSFSYDYNFVDDLKKTVKEELFK